MYRCFKKLFVGKPYSRIEKFLLQIPTWLFVSSTVLILVLLIFWVEEDDIKLGSNPIKVVFQNAEAIAIVTGVALYFKEIPDRKAQGNYEAWQVVDNDINTSTGYARKQALEDLCKSGTSLANISFFRTDLKRINFTGANLAGADFSLCSLQEANFSFANLTEANFYKTFLAGVNFTKADLNYANFIGIHFSNSGTFFPQQIQSAKNWETATYDPEIRVLLGLDP